MKLSSFILLIISIAFTTTLYSQKHYTYWEFLSTNTPLSKLKADAEKNDELAQCLLAQAYYRGNSVTKDIQKAKYWYTQAANQGSADAQTILGLIYHDEGDYENERIWLKKAANQGNSYAQLNLALSYLAERDEYGDNGLIPKAQSLLQESIKAGNDFARYEYGCLESYLLLTYLLGSDPPEENSLGFQCIIYSAEMGDYISQYFVGRYYIENKRYLKGFEWLRKSAEQEFDMAQMDLGVCYYKGIGITKNQQEAIKWWKKAAKQGNNEAKEALRKLNIEY